MEEFKGSSYAKRYQLFCEKLVRERLYDASCFLMSTRTEGLKGEYSETSIEIGFQNFVASLSARASEFAKLYFDNAQ